MQNSYSDSSTSQHSSRTSVWVPSPRSLKSWFLDTSIYYSFDRSGFERHLKDQTTLPTHLEQTHFVITGANAGIGRACAFALAQKQAQLTLICRNALRGEHLIEELKLAYPHLSHDRWHLKIADLSNFEQIDRIEVDPDHAFNGLIHNAGLLPNKHQKTACGLEQTLAVHLAGPLRLSAHLFPYFDLKSSHPFRMIWMSSGGMYTRPLSLKSLNHVQSSPSTYDGLEAYAYTKRAQVELASIFHDRSLPYLEPNSHWEVQSMHPGWVDTSGLKEALPRFWSWTQGRLRSAEQGADTAVWLSAYPSTLPAGFWFDRTLRNPYLLGKKTTQDQRHQLWHQVCKWSDLDSNWLEVAFKNRS